MRKGFTLIELLAVIVILAIVSIVAVPIMLNVIDKAKQGAAESSALGYIDAVEKQVMINKVKSGNEINAGEYTKAELTALGLSIKGEVEDAVVVINEKGKVSQARFYIDGYSLDYDGKKVVTNTVDDYSKGIDSLLNSCSSLIGTEYTFNYTGSEQEFSVRCEGNYKLEVWGAQGGDASGLSNHTGGYGAYATGIITVSKNDKLYINVGGSGNIRNSDGTEVTNGNGYNGGSSTTGWQDHTNYTYRGKYYSGGGGGATHIAKVSGLLKDLESYKGTLVDNKYYVSDEILIVAGGGGAAQASVNDTRGNQWYGDGGHAGGITGLSYPVNGTKSGKGGSQTAPGTSYINSSQQGVAHESAFGLGCEGVVINTAQTISNHISGGGGFYGGGCTLHGPDVGGAGGSSYIASSNLKSDSTTTKHMACYNCSGSALSNDAETKTIAALGVDGTAQSDYAKSGNGYAKITYLGK